MKSLTTRAPVRRQPVPQHQQLAAQMAQQMAAEVDHLSAADRLGIEAEVEVPPGDSGGGRDNLPIEVILQHRRLPTWRPGAHPVGPLAQSALVDEDDGTSLLEGFF
jgi:hypothetical protein